MCHYGLDDYDTDLQLLLAFFPPLSLTHHRWAKELVRKNKRRALGMHAPCPTVRGTHFPYPQGWACPLVGAVPRSSVP